MEELIDNEIGGYYRHPSTEPKIELFSKLISELELASEISCRRSETYNIYKQGLTKTRELRDLEFIVANKSRLTKMTEIGGHMDANDPNTIRRISPSFLEEINTRCKGIFGETYEVNVNDHIGYRIYMNGYFDIALIGFILHLKNNLGCKQLVDVGANIGSVSIPIAVNGFECIGIEANPITYSKLTRNIELNSLDNYWAVNKAATSKREHNNEANKIEMYMPKGNTGATSINENWNPSKGDDYNIRVQCNGDTLDNIISGRIHSKYMILKLDIEGGELDAINGAMNTINEHRPILIIEWNPKLNKEGDKLEKILETLPDFYEKRSLTHEIIATRKNSKSVKIKTASFNPKECYENVIFYDGQCAETRNNIKDLDFTFSPSKK